MADKELRYHRAHLKAAYVYANELSFSRRKKTAAMLVTKEGVLVLQGVNGTPPGEDNNCETVVGKCKVCNGNGVLNSEYIWYDKPIQCPSCYDGDVLITNDNVIHAEDNLSRWAKTYDIDTIDNILYVTLSPCRNCADIIVEMGIAEVYYHEAYRDLSGVEYLNNIGIPCKQIDF